MASKPRTLYEKIWDTHVIEQRDDGTCLIFIDRHLVQIGRASCWGKV